MGSGPVGIAAFGGIVDAPVKAVEVEVHPGSTRGRLPHGELGFPQHEIAQVVWLHRGVDPGIGEDRLEDKAVKFPDFSLAKEGEVQLGGAELATEEEGERFLGSGAVVAAPASGEANTAVDLDLRAGAIRIDPLDGAAAVGLEGPFGVNPTAIDAAEGVGKDTLPGKEVGGISHDREGGQRAKGFLHARDVFRDDPGIHGVVGGHRLSGRSAIDAGEHAPTVGEAGLAGALTDDPGEEEVTVGVDVGGQEAVLECDGTEDGGGIDLHLGTSGRILVGGRDAGAVGGRRFGSVARVGDRASRGGGGDGDGERVIVEASMKVEPGVPHPSRECRAVGGARSGG